MNSVLFGGIILLSLNGAEAAADTGEAGAITAFRFIAAVATITAVFVWGFLILLVSHLLSIVRTPLVGLQQVLDRIRKGATRERVTVEGPTEVSALGDAVNALASELSKREADLRRIVKTDTIDSLINGVAHEVNTPLTVIWANHHLLRRKLNNLTPRNKDLEILVDVLDRNQEQIARLQRLSHALAEVAYHRQNDTHCDLELILSAVITLTHHQRPAGIRLRDRFDAHRLVDMPTGDVFHSLHALVLHAGSKLRDDDALEIWTQDQDDQVIVGIRGSSGGLLPELLELMGRPNDPDGSTPTSDLRFVRMQIMSHGGDMMYSGEEGKEFEWRIRLPAQNVPSQEAALRGATEEKLASKERVLDVKKGYGSAGFMKMHSSQPS